jgi:hypothetical protein
MDEPQRGMLLRMFRHFAELEFAGQSAVYQRLSEVCADDPTLGRPLLVAARPQQRALLLFAATQYLLRTVAPTHTLAGYFPSLGGTRPVDDELGAVFSEFVVSHEERLAQLCARRATQTNEARRCALLLPALLYAARGRPVGLVEVGTSGGLLLLPDRYRYEYTGAGLSVTLGRPDAPAALVMRCEVRGDGWPYLTGELTVASRTGIDLNPVPADDPDGANWLRCCIWPEHVDRLARLDAALAEAATVRPRFITGDMVRCLPDAVCDVDRDVLPIVMSSQAVTYLRRADMSRLVAHLADLGAQRDLVMVLNEADRRGIRHFSSAIPQTPMPEAIGTLTVIAWRDGRPSVTSLGYTGPHGAWLSWDPHDYPFRPATDADAMS